jgi:hypothetical protein
MKNKITIKGPYASENLGDYAMLISTLKTLDELGEFDYNIYTTTKKNLFPSIHEEFGSKENIKLISNKIRFFLELINSKLILYGGGSQITKSRNPLPLLFTVLVSKCFWKKILIYSVDGDYFSFLYRTAIKLSDGIIFRVPEHYEKSKKITEKTYLLPDIATPYFLNIIKKNKRKKADKKFLCHQENFFNENPVFFEKGFSNIQQETKFSKIATKYYLNLYKNAKEVISFHYHTLLFCHLANIKNETLQPNTFKHQSVKKFQKKDYFQAKNKYKNIFLAFLNKENKKLNKIIKKDVSHWIEK